MKIMYKFAYGEITEVDVNDSIGTVILDSRKKEGNLNRKERYHCFSLEGTFFEGDDFKDDCTPETMLCNKEYSKEIQKVIDSLTEIQKRRLKLYLSGMSMREIARREGVLHKAVVDSFVGIRKKFKKFI